VSAKNTSDKDDGPILLDLLQEIKDKRKDPKLFDKSTKVEMVALLYTERYSVHQIAQIFKVCDRTIKRYIKQIKRQNAVKVDDKLSDQIVGELIASENQNFNYLSRLAQSKESKTFEKIQAISAANQSRHSLARILLSTGHIRSQQKDQKSDIAQHDVTIISPPINILPVSAGNKKEPEDVKPD